MKDMIWRVYIMALLFSAFYVHNFYFYVADYEWSAFISKESFSHFWI